MEDFMKRYISALALVGAATPLIMGASVARAQVASARPAAATGTLSGVITDATTHKPMAGVLLTVGYLTKGYQRAGETDANGRYSITDLPVTKGIDAYAFKAGYFYFHGFSAIHAGVTTYSHVMARDTTSVVHPKILSFTAMPPQSDGMAHFGMRAVKGNGPFSFEMMAISPGLGRLVVLGHGAADQYDGALSTSGVKSGMYTFYYVATQENCFENKTFPSARLHL